MLPNGTVGRYLKPGAIRDNLLRENKAHESCTRNFYEASSSTHGHRCDRKRAPSKHDKSHTVQDTPELARSHRSPSPTPADLLSWYHSRQSPPSAGQAGGETGEETGDASGGDAGEETEDALGGDAGEETGDALGGDAGDASRGEEQCEASASRGMAFPHLQSDSLRAANRLAAQKRAERRAERAKLEAKQQASSSPNSLLLAGASSSLPVFLHGYTRC